ncbi:aldose 1-epimerase family protein [Shimia abyssi]|uniref:Galactose mutarotase-like enzyme n=1 Tax=Shimia abyssi TaxID=1662395 RepID=A0A2P8EXT1_9RHOB|nr:aldose 1-epimerase family protein [Shimia abyssi]PSL14272.1 galactose mutarotase-like enzyme [Shimia abyssi]
MPPKELKLCSDMLSTSISNLGAEMQYLRTVAGDDVLWNGDPAFWTGRAPVLFPIVGRAPGDEVAVGDHHAPMSQHGFARRNEFTLEKHTATSCRHILCASPATRAVYPFDFELQITHELIGNALNVGTRVINKSDRVMPFGFGYHPAFQWPLPNTNGATHFVSLASNKNPDQQPLSDGLLQQGVVSGPFKNGILEITDEIFANDALVFPNGSDALRYGPKEGPVLSFEFYNLPDLALWRPLGAPFLCIEPWHGTAALVGDGPQISDRPNSISLPPSEAITFGYSVTVDMR